MCQRVKLMHILCLFGANRQVFVNLSAKREI